MPHRLQAECLRFPVLTSETVEWVYDGRDVGRSERLQIANLCRSHERLRQELAGAERLLDMGATKIARLEDEVIALRTELSRERGTL